MIIKNNKYTLIALILYDNNMYFICDIIHNSNLTFLQLPAQCSLDAESLTCIYQKMFIGNIHFLFT